MKKRHLLEAISTTEWKDCQYYFDGPSFSTQPFFKQLEVRAKLEWLELIIKRAREIEKRYYEQIPRHP